MKPQVQVAVMSHADRLLRTMHWLRLRADILVWRQGWLWCAGLLLLVLAAIAWQWVLRPQHQVLLQVQQDALGLRAQRRTATPSAVLPTLPTPADQAEEALERLRATLGSRSGIGLQLRRLYAMAAKENLVLAHSEYQRIPVLAEGIERMQVDLPFKASYPQLRRFMEAVLIEMPNVSIDQLSFKRVQVSQTQVDVRLRLSLWVGTPDAVASAMPSGKATEGKTP